MLFLVFIVLLLWLLFVCVMMIVFRVNFWRCLVMILWPAALRNFIVVMLCDIVMVVVV